MKKDTVEKLSNLRIAVALLGEKNHWWPTEFFSENASSFLKYAFPRNKQAGLIAACDAVRSILHSKKGKISHWF